MAKLIEGFPIFPWVIEKLFYYSVYGYVVPIVPQYQPNKRKFTKEPEISEPDSTIVP